MSAAMARISRIDSGISSSSSPAETGAETEELDQSKGKRERRQRRRSSISGGISNNSKSSSSRQQQHSGEDCNRNNSSGGSNMRRKKGGSDKASRSLSPTVSNIAKVDDNLQNDVQTSEPDTQDEKPRRKLLLMPTENNIEDPDILPIEPNIEDPDDDDLPFETNNSYINNNTPTSNIEDPDDDVAGRTRSKIADPGTMILPTASNIEDPDDDNDDLMILESNVEVPDDGNEIDEETESEDMSGSVDSSVSEDSFNAVEEQMEQEKGKASTLGKSSRKGTGNKQKKSNGKASRSQSPVNPNSSAYKGSRSLSPVKPDSEGNGDDTPEKIKKSSKKTKKYNLSDRASRSLSPMRKSNKKKTGNSSKDKDKKSDKKEKGDKGGSNSNLNAFAERKRKMKMSGKADPAARPMPPLRSNSSEKARSPVRKSSIRKSKSMDDDAISELELQAEQRDNDKNNNGAAVVGPSPARTEQRKERHARRASRRASLNGPMGAGVINTMPAMNSNVANFISEERKEMRRVSRRASLSGPMGANASEIMDRRKFENEKRAYIRARMRGETPQSERGNLVRTSSAPPTRRIKSVLYTRETPRRNGSFNVKFTEEEPVTFLIPDLTNQERIELYYSRKDIKMFKIDDINRKQRELEMEEQEKKKG